MPQFQFGHNSCCYWVVFFGGGFWCYSECQHNGQAKKLLDCGGNWTCNNWIQRLWVRFPLRSHAIFQLGCCGDTQCTKNWSSEVQHHNHQTFTLERDSNIWVSPHCLEANVPNVTLLWYSLQYLLPFQGNVAYLIFIDPSYSEKAFREQVPAPLDWHNLTVFKVFRLQTRPSTERHDILNDVDSTTTWPLLKAQCCQRIIGL